MNQINSLIPHHNSNNTFQEKTLSSSTIHQERLKYVYIYTILMLIVLYLVFQRAAAFFYVCLKASRRIHNKLFNGIIHAKMYFFQTNPSGRIINRFSQDIVDMDFFLPIALYDAVLVSYSLRI